MPKLKRVRPRRTLKGTGPAEDFFNDAGQKIKNEFTNPDSLLGQAAKKTEQALGNVFDPNKNGLRKSLEAAVENLKKFTADMPADLKAAFDPNENGVAAAFNKFGADTKSAFDELGRRIVAQAQRDKREMDKAFAPLVNELTNPNSVLAKFMQQQIGTEADWRRKFEDPDTYFLIASILITAAATVVTAPIGGVGAPIAFAAMQTALACGKMITHAAQGKPFDPMDAVAIVLAVSGPMISKAAAPVGEYLGTVGEAIALDLGVWNHVYGAATPLAPAAGEWIATGLTNAAVGFGKAALKNQVSWNMRPTEAVGQNFAEVSIANQETGGNSPVSFPEPPGAPRVSTGPPTFTDLKDVPTTIGPGGMVVPVGGPPQVKPPSNRFAEPGGGGAGMNEFSPTYNYSVAGQKVFEPGEKISADDFMKSLYGKGMSGSGLYEDTRKFIGDIRRGGESVYNTGKQIQEAFIDAKEHMAKGNDASKYVSGGMASVEDTGKDLLFGGARGHSRLLAHAQKHRRGRRSSRDDIDPAYFC
jgi:hypothetical protein